MVSQRSLEKLKLQFDIHRLQSELEELISQNMPTPMTPAIDSFPLFTQVNSTENFYDHKLPIINGPMDRNPSAEPFLQNGLQRISQDTYVPTAYFKGYFKEVILELDSLGFWPRGARINCMKPMSSTSLHKDTMFDQYAISLHIPIITNPGVYCVIDGERHVLEADGSAYFCNINKLHQFFNDGSEPRYHLLMAAWDTRGLTEHFKYQYDYIPAGPSLDWSSQKTKVGNF